MIEIVPKTDCTACGACVAACPLQIITLIEDTNGFPYPVVENEKCIECKRCEQACGVLSVSQTRSSRNLYYAATLKNEEDLAFVSSGGAFWALAQTVLSEDGVVYGAQRADDLSVRHVRAASLSEAAPMRRSKYQHSDAVAAYKQAQADLEAGINVLFSGLPCQIEGLLLFLDKEYDNLFTCGIVCHGIPSSKAFRMYCKETEEAAGSRITDVNCRDKRFGWNRNHYAVHLEDGRVLLKECGKHPFHGCYLSGLMYRPSCGHCRYATLHRNSDVTLADFWKYEGRLLNPEMSKGISLILCSSVKGGRLLEKAEQFMEMEEVDAATAIYSCRHLTKSPVISPKRDQFLAALDEIGFCHAAKRYSQRNRIGLGLAISIIRKSKKILSTHIVDWSKT